MATNFESLWLTTFYFLFFLATNECFTSTEKIQEKDPEPRLTGNLKPRLVMWLTTFALHKVEFFGVIFQN
jgi:hypothetical protein